MRNGTAWNVVSGIRALAILAAGLLAAPLFLPVSGVQAQEPKARPVPKYIDTFFQPPDRDRVFRLESADTLQKRMEHEASAGKNPLDAKYVFVQPDYPDVPKVPVVRQWESMMALTFPPYVCHNRLYFEQLNTERYGWSCGLAQPLLSAGRFYFDVAMLPYHAAQKPLQRYECNVGYCLPGDPVPLLCYCQGPSLPGTLAEAAAIGLLILAFP